MGEIINNDTYDCAPVISPDNKYLIFSSYRNYDPITPVCNSCYELIKNDFGEKAAGLGTLYWVSAKIIEELRPKE